MGLTKYEPGTYWMRRKVEPYLMRSPRAKLHTNLEVGTFVEIAPKYFPDKAEVAYFLVENRRKQDIITDKMFGIYFERVTKENELGLIKLIEQPDS
jgi:hypothetical protein